MFESFVDLVIRSEWAVAAVFAVAALDAIFPLVPSEATVVTAGALTVSGKLSLLAVVAAAAGGAFVGDNGAYLLGRLSKRPLDRLARSATARHGLPSATEQLARHAGTIVVVSRFIPGGRTVTMLTAGATRLRWRRFAGVDLVAACVWAGYCAGLGVAGGVAFTSRPLYGVGLALVLAAVLTVAVETGRRFSRNRGKP